MNDGHLVLLVRSAGVQIGERLPGSGYALLNAGETWPDELAAYAFLLQRLSDADMVALTTERDPAGPPADERDQEAPGPRTSTTPAGPATMVLDPGPRSPRALGGEVIAAAARAFTSRPAELAAPGPVADHIHPAALAIEHQAAARLAGLDTTAPVLRCTARLPLGGEAPARGPRLPRRPLPSASLALASCAAPPPAPLPVLLGEMWRPMDTLARWLKRGGALLYEPRAGGYVLLMDQVPAARAHELEELAACLDDQHPPRRANLRLHASLHLMARVRRVINRGESLGAFIRAAMAREVAARIEDEESFAQGEDLVLGVADAWA